MGGGVAVETIEAWLLALAGRRRTEELSAAAAKRELGVTAGAAVTTADNLADDAASLRTWLERVAAALSSA